MKFQWLSIILILVYYNCLSQNVSQIGCRLKSENIAWVNTLNELDDADKKLQFAKDKIKSDLNNCLGNANNPIRLKLELLPNESIDDALRDAYENTDYNCALLFILTINKKYSIPLNSFGKVEFELISPKDIDSVTTLTDYKLTHIYGSRYCGVVLFHSNNRKLKRKIKNRIQ